MGGSNNRIEGTATGEYCRIWSRLSDGFRAAPMSKRTLVENGSLVP